MPDNTLANGVETEKIELPEKPKKETKKAEPIAKVQQLAEKPYYKEMDRKLSHKDRIVAFLEKRDSGNYVPLNDFLKSLYPPPIPPERPGWTNQGHMRKLRQDLRELVAERKITLSNSNHERLGDNYHTPPDMRRADHNLDTIEISGRLG